MSRRRAMMPSGRLPSGYQEVEWIGSNGGRQYIQTNYVPVVGDDIYIKLARNTTSSILTPYYAGTGEYQFGQYNSYYKYFTTGDASAGLYIDLNYVYEIHYLPDGTFKLYRDGDLIKTSTTEVEKTKGAVNTTLFLFCRANLTSNSPAKIYDLTIKDKIHLIPCYRKSDDEIGMYDIVNDVFYTNAGTGTFTKGADVN